MTKALVVLSRSWIAVLFLLFCSYPMAFAYLPPANFIYEQLAEQKTKTPNPILQISVSRPSGSGTEEVLGSLWISSWGSAKGGWPVLSLLFSGDSEQVVNSVEAFGIPVAKEVDLLRAGKEQIQAMKEPPKPFYKTDKRMSLKRYKQSFAWVHRENQNSIWIEKDTFILLKIEAPCPEAVSDLNWAKAGGNLCEIEFRNISAIRRGAPQNSRMVRWKDGVPLLFFSFEKVQPPKPGQLPNTMANTTPSEISNLSAVLFH